MSLHCDCCKGLGKPRYSTLHVLPCSRGLALLSKRWHRIVLCPSPGLCLKLLWGVHQLHRRFAELGTHAQGQACIAASAAQQARMPQRQHLCTPHFLQGPEQDPLKLGRHSLCAVTCMMMLSTGSVLTCTCSDQS